MLAEPCQMFYHRMLYTEFTFLLLGIMFNQFNLLVLC